MQLTPTAVNVPTLGVPITGLWRVTLTVLPEPRKTCVVTLYGYMPNCKKSPGSKTTAVVETDGKLPTVIVVLFAGGTDANVSAFTCAVVKVPWYAVNHDKLALLKVIVSGSCLSLLSIDWIMSRACG